MGNPKIRSVTAFRINNSILGGGEGHSERSRAYYYEFDENGNRVHEISYSDDEPEQEIKRVFNDGHLMNEEIHFITDDMKEIVKYEYDEKGLIQKVIRSYSDGSTEVAEYSYNDGHPSRKTIKDDDGEVETEDVFVYENGKLKEHTVIEYGEVKHHVLRRHNETGEPIEEVRKTEDGRTFKVVFEPKSDGKLPDTKVYNDQGKLVEVLVYRYDEQGRLVQELVETTNKGYRKMDTRYSYDDGNRITSEETLDQNGLVRKRISRQYDEDGTLVNEHVHEENPEIGSYYDLVTEFEYTHY